MDPSNSSELHTAGECLGQSLGLRFDRGPFGGVRVVTETKVTLSDDAWRRPDLAELLLLTWFLRAQTESFGGRVFGKPKKRPKGDFP